MRLTLILAFLLAGRAFPQESPTFVIEGTINAPIESVWKIWTSGEGYRALGIAKADVDFRVGGLIRTHYKENGVLGDEETIINRILAYEPLHMLAVRIDRPPKSFPFKEAWKQTWTVITLSKIGDTQTHLRMACMGYGTDEESLAMRRFFENGNAYTLKTMQAHFESKMATGEARPK